MRTPTLPPALLGDRMLTAAAVVLAARYTLLVGSHAADIVQVVVSWCFVPFFWVWRSRPAVSATGFLACLLGWSLAWFIALPHNTGISPWLVTAPMAVYATARYCAD